MRRVVIAAIAGLAIFVSVGLAGTLYKVTCSDEKCGFAGDFGDGGGFTFEQATGYCVKCDKFATVSWKRKSPAPVTAEIWDAAEGRRVRLFTCKDCKGPFAEIRGAKELKHCPRCSKPSPTTKPSYIYD
jgi:hypothetical protein